MNELAKTETTMNELVSKTLAEIVKENLHSAIVFEEYGLDFCCRGNRSLKNACDEKEIDMKVIVNELEKLSGSDNGLQNIDDWDLSFLIDYIINNHHQYVRRMIPIISLHSDKVASVHSKNHPETLKIADFFLAVREELQKHMIKEERMLFPYIKQLDYAKKNNEQIAAPPFGTIRNPMMMMESEHKSAGDAMYNIRELSVNYNPPADACNTFKALYSEFKEFEADLHKHIHLENNILFPKSIKLEGELF
jgi:regulator of cell morphogenesis and NO signaling